MRAIVTGGTGFIGSNIAKALASEGDQVFVTGLETNFDFQGLPITYLGSNFINLPWSEIGNVDVVFHQAACNETTLLDRDFMFKVNLEWSKQLFEEAKSAGVKNIVYASSTAVYGNTPPPFKESGPFEPLNPYAESKLALDDWVHDFSSQSPNLTIVGLRYCNVYGPGEAKKGKRATMIYQLAQTMLKENPRLFKYGEQKRDYLYVKDVVVANLLGAKAKESCVVNCGLGKATSFNEVVEILNKVLKTNRKPDYFENPITKMYQGFTECDMSKAKKILGFVPAFDIRKGIEDYFKSGALIS